MWASFSGGNLKGSRLIYYNVQQGSFYISAHLRSHRKPWEAPILPQNSKSLMQFVIID